MSAFQEAQRAAMPEEAAAKKGQRDKVIVRTSIVGILANLMLAAFKAAIGVLTGSIAITMDAVNNLSDAASSIITIIGTKLASKPANREHPFGYGRVEYLSAMVISLIVLYAGVTSLEESIKAILQPELPDYSTMALVIVAVGVVVKVLLGRYVASVGNRVNSDSLVNSGKDATLDSVISASTLVAALVFMGCGVSLEAWLGALISLVIVKSGVEMLGETLSQVLGERAGAELARKIKNMVGSFDQVRGAYDLVLHNYGPDAYNGSIHIEVPDTLNADQIDGLTRAITQHVYMETGVYLTAISVYSYNTKDPQIAAMRDCIQDVVMSHDNVLQMHAFYVDLPRHEIRFDMVISFDEKDRLSLYHHISDEIQRLYPDFSLITAMDTDYAEE